MRDDILIQAIDNTEDVLLHGARWSEEAKQRVRQARRAGRRVSEMFGDMYKNTRRGIDKAGKNVKGMANEIDSKYNISDNNGRTRALYNKEKRNASTVIAPPGKVHEVANMLVDPQGGKRRDHSVEARLRQALFKQSKTKYADKQFKDNIRRYDRATTKYVNNLARKKINAKRERIQERRITGK